MQLKEVTEPKHEQEQEQAPRHARRCCGAVRCNSGADNSDGDAWLAWLAAAALR